MATPKTKIAATDALVGLWAVALASFVIATLYFARDLLIPLALSALLTFLLAPLVSRLERWIGRIAAVLVVVALIFAGLGATGWMLTRQLVDLATKLPEYKGNIIEKLHAFHTPKGGAFTKLSETIEDLKKELPGGSGAAAPNVTQEPGKPETSVASPPAERKLAVPVEVVETATEAHPMELAKSIIAPLLGPLGTGALVLILVIFMLLQREDLRSRLIRLIGQGRISATTRAMDDASGRVSRYLLMQFMVNVTYGVCIATGLYFIGVPNFGLWGAFGTVLRFIPYVGPWVATILPTILALAVSPHWTMPILTVALFTSVELLLNNVMEPLLYGRHTGTSSVALIIAAVFWTWLWGPIGLVLATPLTVCLVVMGRHVPRLAFLSVLLSDEEALTPAEDCYHRLLTPGEHDELELVESYLKAHPLTALYDAVFIPVITAAETDARLELLDQEQLTQIEQSMRDIIEDLGMRPPPAAQSVEEKSADPPVAPLPLPAPGGRVYCLSARAERDELAGAMLAQLLQQQAFEVQNASAKLAAGELVELVGKASVDAICISVVPPSTVIHARYLCTKLRARLRDLKIVVGLWGATENLPDAGQRLRASGADEIVTTLAEALVQLGKFVPPLGETLPAPLHADEEARLAALHELHLLDTEPEPVFDRFTAKLARIFDVQLALIMLVDRERQFIKSQAGAGATLAETRQIPRAALPCSYVIASNETLVVDDLARDRRFAGSPLVRARGLRFYAGVPLHAPNGQPIGTLSVLDTAPRQLTPREKRLLEEYAREVTEEISLRVPAPTSTAAA